MEILHGVSVFNYLPRVSYSFVCFYSIRFTVDKRGPTPGTVVHGLPFVTKGSVEDIDTIYNGYHSTVHMAVGSPFYLCKVLGGPLSPISISHSSARGLSKVLAVGGGFNKYDKK